VPFQVYHFQIARGRQIRDDGDDGNSRFKIYVMTKPISLKKTVIFLAIFFAVIKLPAQGADSSAIVSIPSNIHL
jgi:hypothetical protein